MPIAATQLSLRSRRSIWTPTDCMLCWIGDLTVDYDRMGSRPRELVADDESPVDVQLAVVIAFLVLVAFQDDD